MKSVVVVLLTFIALDSCIEPLFYNVSNGKNLVVDGMITDQPGPYTVSLYYSKEIGSETYAPERITGCKVIIHSDAGENEQLKETKPGYYQTSLMQGQVGRTYKLSIVTPNGHAFESLPETMQPVGEIIDVYKEFKLEEDPTRTDYVNTRNGFNLYVDAQLVPEEHRVRWRWHGTYEVFTYPELKIRKEKTRGGRDTILYVAPLCSYCDPATFTTCDRCYCCTCWVDLKGDRIYLSNANLNGSNTLKKQLVGFIPATRRLLYNKFRIEVDQMSVTDAAYDYWKRIEVQTQSNSDLFQAPPPNTIGNIVSLSSNELVFGIFSANSIRTKAITIYRDEVPYSLPKIDTIKESCLVYFSNSTVVKPIGW